MVRNHVYIEIDNNKYYDYSLYSDEEYYIDGDYDFYVDLTTDRRLEELDGLIDPTIFPAEDSKVYLAPNLPVAIDDIRKHYTIKRGMDNGEYNVFAKRVNASWYAGHIYSVGVFPKIKAIVFNTDFTPKEKIFRRAQTFFTNISESDMIYKDIVGEIRGYKNSLAYKALLDGAYTNPCIEYRQLNLNSENELTSDVLELFYRTATKSVYDIDAKKNFLIQINVLNQHNWREYPGTVSYLVNVLCCRGVGSYIKRHLCQYSKTVKEILSLPMQVFANEKDFLLARTFVAGLLNINNTKFVSATDLIDKINEYGISLAGFSRLFDNIVRITPKEYVSEEKKEAAA